MALPTHKTKIVCTIGPASGSGNHGADDPGRNEYRPAQLLPWRFCQPRENDQESEGASRSTGQRLAIMADLPGPKMRIGQFSKEPIELRIGDLSP